MRIIAPTKKVEAAENDNDFETESFSCPIKNVKGRLPIRDDEQLKTWKKTILHDSKLCYYTVEFQLMRIKWLVTVPTRMQFFNERKGIIVNDFSCCSKDRWIK